jgi:hypothetical protein
MPRLKPEFDACCKAALCRLVAAARSRSFSAAISAQIHGVPSLQNPHGSVEESIARGADEGSGRVEKAVVKSISSSSYGSGLTRF